VGCIGKSLFIVLANMVGNIIAVVTEYEERLRGMQSVSFFSHGRRMLRSDGAPSKAFFYSLFNHHPMVIEFLKDIGLIRRTMR
jgi:hypothetical protein